VKFKNVRIPAFARMTTLIGCALLIVACATQQAAPPGIPSHAVIGVDAAQLTPGYWVGRAPSANRVVLEESDIRTQNERLQKVDPSLHDIRALPAQLSGAQVKEWVEKLSERPSSTLYDEQGKVVSAGQIETVVRNVALDSIPATQQTRYGMTVHRANLRTFPTALRVFRSADDTDIDRFQESALFPGTPLVIAHTSTDGQWYFVVSQSYAAWVERRFVAQGSAIEVFGYADKTPYVIVTGTTAKTVFTRERPEVSEVELDMSTRVPLLADWPADRPVNGQHPYTSYVVQLPWRDANGALHFSPALIPKTADVSTKYLPLTRATLLTQSFKFLGERYGWGHAYNARDCSGFVSDVYRSFGLQMPRNTRDQGVSPAFERITFEEKDSYDARLAVVRTLQIGDLVYIPGHVMMVIGNERGMPYIIHDTTGINYRDGDGEVRRVHLNGVSVTPLVPLLLGEDRPMIERIYSIVLMRKR
jgi:cell wall-associated NlpC family hydrolase